MKTTTLLLFGVLAFGSNVFAQQTRLDNREVELARIQIREGSISESSLNLVYSFSIGTLHLNDIELLALNDELKAKDIKVIDSKLNIYSEKELSTTEYGTLKDWIKSKGINFESLEKYYVLLAQ